MRRTLSFLVLLPLAACGGEVAPPPAESPDASPSGPDDVSCTPAATDSCYDGPGTPVGVCHEGVRTCGDDRTWGACEDQQLPGDEVCNGLDDDCRGDVDEGCPIDGRLAVGATTTSALYGGSTTWATANTPFTLSCPEGSAIVGFHGRDYESFDALGIICGTPTIEHLPGEGGYRYVVAVSPSESLPAQGGPGGGAFESRCPGGEVVTSVRLWTADNGNGGSLYGLALTCHAFAIAGEQDNFFLQRGPIAHEVARTATGNAGVAAIPSDMTCPGTQMLTSITGYYGPWAVYNGYTVVNGLTLDCTATSLPMTPAAP